MTPKRMFSTRLAILAAVATAALCVAAAGCSPRIDKRGNLPDADAIAGIRTGVDTQADVAAKLGTPSSVATFDRNTWYYISKETESLAFFEPTVVDQQVLAVKFDDAGLVKDVQHFNMDDGKEVQVSSRVSPTLGREKTLIEQLYDVLLRGRGNQGTNEGFVK